MEPRRGTIGAAATGVGASRPGSNPKIGLPVGPPNAIVRQDHVQAIQRQPHLVIVRAPAGYGKTTLVGQWAAARRDAGELVAWVTVDRLDDDVHAFWSLIIAAIDEAAGGGDGAMSSLMSPRAALESGFLAAFAHAISALERPVSLVIDDLHEIRDPTTLQSLEALARTVHSSFRVVLVSRTQPPIAVQRLGLVDGYELLDPESLRFGPTEAEELLALHGVELERAQLDSVLERTEGWAAGLRFVATTIDPTAPHAGDVTAANVPIDAYLAEEIFERHPREVRQFLLATSIADHVQVDLARTLSGRDDAAAVLERLQYDNMLITRTDTEPASYRYHALLRDFLRSRLRARSPERWRQLHALASVWFAEQGEALTSLAHATRGEDIERVDQIMSTRAFEFIAHGDGPALRTLVDSMSRRMLRSWSCALPAAAAFLDVGDVVRADALLRGYEPPDEPAAAPGFAAIDSTVRLQRARMGGDIAAALERSLMTADAPSSDPYVEVQALLHRGAAMLYLGRSDEAIRPLRNALQVAESLDEPYLTMQCLAHLSALSGERGDLNAVVTHGEHALEIGRRHGWYLTSVCGFAHDSISGTAFLRIEDERAETHARMAIESLSDRSDPTFVVSAESVWAMVTFDSATDRLATVTRLHETWQRYDDEVLPPGLLAYVASYELRMCLKLGLLTWSDDVIRRAERRVGDSGELSLLRAIRAADHGLVLDADAHLQRVLDAPETCMAPGTLIEAWLLKAEIAHGRGQSAATQASIWHALDEAGTQRIYRPFLLVSGQLQQLIQRELVTAGVPAGAENLMAALSDHVSGEAITEREVELLRELQVSHQVVVERTIEEAAAVLFISPNTAKTHLRSIYRKLGVNSRNDAINLARRRGLL